MNFSTNRRLENSLTVVARKHGYNGSPFLHETPPLGLPEQEMAAIALSLSVRPRPQTPRLKDLVRRWARNIVLSSTEPDPPTPLPSKRRSVKW